MARIRTILATEVAAGRDVHNIELHEGGVFDIVARARLALVKSGTSTMQTTLCGTPQVVVYQIPTRREAVVLHTLITSPWIAAPNLIMARDAIPEFFFWGPAGWPRVLAALTELWPAGYQRGLHLAVTQAVRQRLSGTGGTRETVRWLLRDPPPA